MTDPSVVGQHQVSGDRARGEQTASYFDLKNPGSPESDCVDAPPGRFRLMVIIGGALRSGGHGADFDEVVARTPCPVQIRAPWVLSMQCAVPAVSAFEDADPAVASSSPCHRSPECPTVFLSLFGLGLLFREGLIEAAEAEILPRPPSRSAGLVWPEIRCHRDVCADRLCAGICRSVDLCHRPALKPWSG
jgi:hypothetical protein